MDYATYSDERIKFVYPTAYKAKLDKRSGEVIISGPHEFFCDIQIITSREHGESMRWVIEQRRELVLDHLDIVVHRSSEVLFRHTKGIEDFLVASIKKRRSSLTSNWSVFLEANDKAAFFVLTQHGRLDEEVWRQFFDSVELLA